MNPLIVKSIGKVVKSDDAIALISCIAPIAIPHIAGLIEDIADNASDMYDTTTDKAIVFANNVMGHRYRFKAGPIILEPAPTTTK